MHLIDLMEAFLTLRTKLVLQLVFKYSHRHSDCCVKTFVSIHCYSLELHCLHRPLPLCHNFEF